MRRRAQVHVKHVGERALQRQHGQRAHGSGTPVGGGHGGIARRMRGNVTLELMIIIITAAATIGPQLASHTLTAKTMYVASSPHSLLTHMEH